MSEQSLSQIILATSCALRYKKKPQQSRLHRKCCSVYSKLFACGTSMPVRLRVWLQHLYARLLAYLSSNTAPCLPSSRKKERKLNSVWHWTSKTKCREVDGRTEGKGQVANFVILVYFILVRLAGLQFLCRLVFTALVIRHATASKEWVSVKVQRIDSRSVLNGGCAATGGQAHIAGGTHFHKSLSGLKQRVTSSAGCMKDLCFDIAFFKFIFLYV